MSHKVKVGIIGATGYTGVELLRLLMGHGNASVTALGSKSFVGKQINEIYNNLEGICGEICLPNEEIIEKSDVVFGCLPHGNSEEFASECYKKGVVFIDLGADFRLESEDDYFEWYNLKFSDKEIHKQAVYGLPELFREKIRGKKIIANPGCYPTSVALGLAPLLKNNMIEISSIIIDSKSGTTGGGRGLSQTFHFAECNEAFAPYKIAEHRHTPEIEQTLSALANQKVTVSFVPHLLPINRGIISTIYSVPKKKSSREEVFELYKQFYQNERFIRLLPPGRAANLKNVRYSNFCDISVHYDERTDRIITVTAIDNMIKGASGQAIQNMNIVFGFDEGEGLNLLPPAF